jgi:hypothetical protein
MPEQLTKHPEVTLQVLRSAGAQCGAGAPQDILATCPVERFCKLPGGEICVYGLDDAPRMTQIGASDWRALLPAVSSVAAPGSAAATTPPSGPTLDWPLGAGLLLAGAALGWMARRR